MDSGVTDQDSSNATNPAFDGHLEHPMQSLSDGERLKLIWEGTLLRHWARTTKLRAPNNCPSSASTPPIADDKAAG
jgi:hypothetical protein